jgi:hypothetical protein
VLLIRDLVEKERSGAAAMRAVSGEVVSWKPVHLGKTARIIAALEASGLPAEAAGAEERPEEPRKKRKRSGTGV